MESRRHGRATQWKGALRGIPGRATVGRAFLAKGTRDRKLERALVDPNTALVSEDLDAHGDDDEMQGLSQQGVAISPSLT
jgi:hypothetical protein